MDFFRLLARGAQLSDTSAFTKQEKPAVADDQTYISRELDFFHTHTTKPKQDEPKKQTDSAELKHEPTSAVQHRSNAKIKISGLDIPQPLANFADLATRFNISELLKKAVKSLNFASPTPIQSEAVPALVLDRDLIACAPTGSGKTLAYALPIVHRLQKHSTKGVRALIIVPTKELATQISAQFTLLSKNGDLKVTYLSKSIIAKLSSPDTLTRAAPDVLVCTPLRLVHAIKSGLDLSQVRHLILDEADRLFETGFDGQTDDILLALKSSGNVQKAFFSATITSGVEQLANGIMTSPLRIIVGRGGTSASESVEQKLVYAGSEEGKLIAIRQMLKTGELVPPVLVFVQSIDRANALFNELVYDGVNVDVIHGERTESQRKKIIERFKKAEIWVLICTDVLARGIDVHGVNLVINYDVPQSSQAYIHRIGRTGRAGKKGTAVTYFTKQDLESIKSVINVMKESGCEVEPWMNNLGKVSKKKKKELKRKPIERKEISTTLKKKRKRSSEKDQQGKVKEQG
ncbi:P-loop containing nucleoside triphosphate hydrolase protein [Lipomyces japonicus]|uniref:P-loop containing nucleoside triphosphate hydrolase protein n=1 Tax=Lipomyces japonicus TaxID=56871 RepID=UPI0034CD27E1